MKNSHHILLTSFVMTVIIFSIGIMVSYWLDFERIDEIQSLIAQHEIDNEAFLLEQDFLDYSGTSSCGVLEKRMTSLNEEIIEVGKDLSKFGDKSIFKKEDFEQLRRKYLLSQLKFYMLGLTINDRCTEKYIPILFFYQDEDPLSQRQGLILQEISEEYKQEVIVLTIDKDFIEEPLVSYLTAKYNITTAPTIIIGDIVKFEGITYGGEINSTIIKVKRKPDPYAGDINFSYVLSATGTDVNSWSEMMREEYLSADSPMARGDILYAVGRVTGNATMICDSLMEYDQAVPGTREEEALLYETMVSVGCGRNRRAFLLEAAGIWEEIGNSNRAAIDRKLALKERVDFPSINSTLVSGVQGHHSLGKVIIGQTSFLADRSDLVLSQSDRVNRDWLGGQLNVSPFSPQLLVTFSERLTYGENDLRSDIGWHEGGRLGVFEDAGIPRMTASGTLVVKRGDRWYAPDEKGNLMFVVPIDKVSYPTTRFLSPGIAVVMDTHGINMLVEQAMRLNATIVVGCCDHPGKVAAAKYLADRGKKVICFTDKYLPLILGYQGDIVGSPPLKRNGNRITIGNQPVTIDISRPIVVSNVTGSGVQSYYDTPARYFNELRKYAKINVRTFNMTAMNQTYDMMDMARRQSSHVVGVRVYSYDDYLAVKMWLLEDSNRSAVLFHSASYPYGYLLMQEFPTQTTFDDLDPKII